MDRVASEVTCRDKPIGRNLSLDAEIPRVPCRLRVVVRNREIATERREIDIGRCRFARERVSTGIGLPGIVEAARRTGYGNAGRPGRGHKVIVEASREHVVRRGVRGTDRHAAVAMWIPGES